MTIKPPINIELSEQERLIIYYIIYQGSINNAKACKVLGLKPARVKEIFKAMVDKGLILAIGERKARKYILK